MDELENPNVVKVVTGTTGQALYFSRSVIPFRRDAERREWISGAVYFKHIGIYGYEASVLDRIVALPPAPLEQYESLEQLRWLSAGFGIQTQETEYESIAIDTPEDVLKIPRGM